MLVAVEIRGWTGQITDKMASTDVTTRAHAAHDAARVRKNLLAGCDSALRAVIAAGHRVRAVHRSMTLPWSEGTRILPASEFSAYASAMADVLAAHTEAIERFLDSYDSARTRAQSALGALFDASDYPTRADLERRFGARRLVLPFPDATDWRVDIGADEREAIRQQTEHAIAERMSDATRDLWSRLVEVLDRAASKLADPDGIFRDSLIGNVRDLIDRLPRLNLTDDAALSNAVDEVSRAIASYDPQTLRDDASTRAKVAAKAAALAASYAVHA